MALLQKRNYRNGTALWFAAFASRSMFRRLGYSSSLEELRDDEAEWFKAVDRAYADAGEALKLMKKAGKGR